MTVKFTRMTHKIAIQLHLVAESCTICSSRSRRPVRKLLDTPSYLPNTTLHRYRYTNLLHVSKYSHGRITMDTIHCLRAVIAQLVLRWATGWTIGVLWFDSRRGLGIFFSSPPRPERLWGPLNLLSNAYQGLFPCG
jgi:hypothetical protein